MNNFQASKKMNENKSEVILLVNLETWLKMIIFSFDIKKLN